MTFLWIAIVPKKSHISAYSKENPFSPLFCHIFSVFFRTYGKIFCSSQVTISILIKNPEVGFELLRVSSNCGWREARLTDPATESVHPEMLWKLAQVMRYTTKHRNIKTKQDWKHSVYKRSQYIHSFSSLGSFGPRVYPLCVPKASPMRPESIPDASQEYPQCIPKASPKRP